MHSPEPWNYVPSHGIHSAVSTSGPRRGKTEYVADVASDDVSQAKRDENAQRIVACVNALAGVQDPAAFMQSVGSLVRAVKSSRLLTTPSLQARCDEVLEHRQMEIPT